jgi:hypothetical protein
MPTKLGNTLAVAALVATLIFAPSAAGTVVYETDFSSDPFNPPAGEPAWDVKVHPTNDPSPGTNDTYTWTGSTLAGSQANTLTSAVYVHTPFYSHQSWRLEFDSMIDECDWSAGLVFGLCDADMTTSIAFAGTGRSISDNGHTMSVAVPGLSDWEDVGWQLDKWYRSVVQYDADLGELNLDTWDRATGEPLASLGISGVSLPSNLEYIAATRLHMEGYNSATDQWELDNVRLTGTVPEPTTFLLLGTSVAALLVARRRQRLS